MNQYTPVQIGESAQAEPVSREQLIDAVVAQRSDQWKAAVEAELQDLITEASIIRKEISTAKTNTKKKYFEKKFKKVNQEVRQMVAALHRIQQVAAATPLTAEANESTSSAE